MDDILKKINAPLSQLGEGLCWNSNNDTLFWLDIEGYSLHQYHIKTDAITSYDTDKFIGMITLMDNGNFCAFADNELWNFNTDNFTWNKISKDFTKSAHDILVNDGKADRFGNLIVGTKHKDCELPMGALYYYAKGYEQGKKILDNITVCNGPAFNPEGTIMYFADSPTGKIMAYDYNENGNISNERVFATLPKGALPDGMTVDADGYLWNAEWNGSCVKRYNPNGQIDKIIEMPVPLITNVCFGGEDLQTLFITTAYSGLTKSQRNQYPDSGATYMINLSYAKGIAENILTL